MDATFKTKIENTEAITEDLPEGKTPPLTTIDDGIEVPYTDYRHSHGKHFTVEYFDLGMHWDDPQGGFENEINTIEDYFTHRIDNGEIENSVEAIKAEIKQMEKINNLENEFRKVIKVGVLASYVKFLRETEGLKAKVRKHAN